MNPYGRIWRCKGSFLPQSEEPGVNHVTPGSCKRPDLLRLDSKGEISSDDQRTTMTGGNQRNCKPFPSKCSQMKNLMNSTLFSWSRLSQNRQFMSLSTPTRSDIASEKFNIVNDMAKDMNKKQTDCPTKVEVEGNTGYRVPQMKFHKHCETFHNNMRNHFRFQPSVTKTFSNAQTFSKGRDFDEMSQKKFMSKSSGYKNMHEHWNNNHHHHHNQGGGRGRRNPTSWEVHHRKKPFQSDKQNQFHKQEDAGSCAKEITLNSVNMLKNLLLQNEIINNAKLSSSSNNEQDKSQEIATSQSDETGKCADQGECSNIDSQDSACDGHHDEGTEQDSQNDFPDWFSMGRSDSVDGIGITCPPIALCTAKLRSYSIESDIGLGKSECEDLTSLFKEQDLEQSNCANVKIENPPSSVPKFESSAHESSQEPESVCEKNGKEKLKDAGKTPDKLSEKENENIESKDYSFILFVRNSNKKCRPSSKKRQRSKARMQECTNVHGDKHISVNVKNVNQKDGSNKKGDFKTDPENCSPNTVAFILGFDSEDDIPNAATTRSFIVSFSDSDTDSDFGSDEDEETFSDDQHDDFDFPEFANHLNLNVICSVQKQEDPENSKLKALNKAWQINIQVNECKQKPNRKVHFADEEHLTEVHPMFAWSYAYQAARKGPWEEYARDRERFKKRITELEGIISPVLQTEHRQKVYSSCDN